MTIEGVCNQALDLIGYKRHITSVWDGSKAARIALNTWSETRDALLATQQPRWAKRDTVLVLLRQAPSDFGAGWSTAVPDIPWLYEYDTPEDCLVPLTIKAVPMILPVWRPRPVSFRAKRNSVDQKYTILTNQADAILTCIYSVRDPDLWEPEFTEMVIRGLAQKFNVGLGERPMPRQQQQEQPDANAA